MKNPYKDDKALCQWLRENSSGAYSYVANFAADRIETLLKEIENLEEECRQLERDKYWSR